MASVEFIIDTSRETTMLDVEGKDEDRFGMVIGGATNIGRHEEEYDQEPGIVAVEMCAEVGERALRLVSSADSDH